MAAKMEVLSRGGERARPRVVLDPTLSLSFQLPASMRRAPPSAEPPTDKSMGPPAAEQEDDEQEDEEESWESKDWGREEPVAPQALAAGATGKLRRVVDTSMAVRSVDAWGEEEDEWEEAAAPELPDDFPLLVVNLSRLRDLHFRSESGAGAAAIAMDTDDELRAFYATVKATLHEHFTQMTEVLFDQEVCFHTQYGAQRRVLENLHRAFPTHVFALVDYPPELNGLALHEYLHVLSAPTRWPSVNYLKDCLRKCSRDLEWKFEIAIEIEKLAQQEHGWWAAEQQRRSDEIDALTRLRDSFREKLASADSASAKNASQYMLLRKLEDIETRLVALIDVFLKEPELTARESRELMGFMEAAPAMQMRNVLDMVVAMVFSRLPRDYGSQPTNEAHFEMLLDHHVHIRRLWKKDFGRLPVRTGVEPRDDDEEDDDDAEKEEMMTKLEDDFDQYGSVDGVDENLVDEEDEEDQPGLHDDWEAIVDDQHEDQNVAEEQVDDDGEPSVRTVAKPTADGLDGYGADYESGSDTDDRGADQKSEAQPSVAAKRVVRRTRRAKKKRDSSPSSDAADRSPSPVFERLTIQSERERALEAFMYGGGGSDSSSGDDQGGGRMFQSYARTGALQLLRRAKENEGF